MTATAAAISAVAAQPPVMSRRDAAKGAHDLAIAGDQHHAGHQRYGDDAVDHGAPEQHMRIGFNGVSATIRPAIVAAATIK